MARLKPVKGERFSADTRLLLEDARECECGLPYGLTYQKCRFCGAGWPEEKELWKYNVRHYACTACRKAALAEEDASRRAMQAELDRIAAGGLRS